VSAVTKRRSFTLIEMMAALVLFLAMSIIVIEVFGAAQEVVFRAKANSQMYRQARAVLDIIESDLAKAYVDQTGRFFYCGEYYYDDATTTNFWPTVPLELSVSFPPAWDNVGANTRLAKRSKISVFATANADHRLIHPVLAAAGAPATYQVMYYLRHDGVLMRMVENFDVPDHVPDADSLSGVVPGSAARAFWMKNDLATFYRIAANDPSGDFTTEAGAFANAPRYQTCQVVDPDVGELSSDNGLLTDDAATTTVDEVNDYYLLSQLGQPDSIRELSANVRFINFRFFDADSGTNNWVGSWNDVANWTTTGRKHLPHAVHVTVEMESDNGRWTAAFSTLVYIGS